MMAIMPVKHLDMQAAMNTHLSQSTGIGAFDGQHGISLAISSVMADGDISSAIGCIEAWEDGSAMTGRATGANARPAITRTASSRRMVKVGFTDLDSQTFDANRTEILRRAGTNRNLAKQPSAIAVNIMLVSRPPGPKHSIQKRDLAVFPRAVGEYRAE